MELENIPLWPNDDPAYRLVRYIRTWDQNRPRPAMIVIPGGGYCGVCNSTEGIPIADRFASLGFQVFILNYHVKPFQYPSPQKDILRAIKLVRANAAKWNVTDKVALVGFSAGGHLAAYAGTLFRDVVANAGDEADNASPRPDGIVLAYPVITFIGNGHFDSGHSLCGERYEEMKAQMSLETRVTANTPPTFLWHTAEDTAVPMENSFLFFNALQRYSIPSELHIFPFGVHGRQMGYGDESIAQWPHMAKLFLMRAAGFTFPEETSKKTVYLTFDDAVTTQIENVVPLLRKYNFGATFYITRFSDQWRKEHSQYLLSHAQVKQLYDLGFKIGNHTWSHPDLSQLDADAIEEEISSLNRFLVDAGIPSVDSFAYPGGPYDAQTANILPRMGIHKARTTEKDFITSQTDPMRIPAWSMSADCFPQFKQLVDQITTEKSLCILFHGIPDIVHPWVDTKPEVFEKCMEYLAAEQIDVKAL